MTKITKNHNDSYDLPTKRSKSWREAFHLHASKRQRQVLSSDWFKRSQSKSCFACTILCSDKLSLPSMSRCDVLKSALKTFQCLVSSKPCIFWTRLMFGRDLVVFNKLKSYLLVAMKNQVIVKNKFYYDQCSKWMGLLVNCQRLVSCINIYREPASIIIYK